MSVRVMSQVWELNLPASEKLVLLAISDCANDDGLAWPGMKTLVRKCTKSDRTIQCAIKSLVDQGHLSRVETPGKGCEYYVHPVLPSGMEGYEPTATHYTYRITCQETGEFYVGARSCYGEPASDPYIGSGEWIKAAKARGLNLTKEVLTVFPSRGALAIGEQELTRAVKGLPLCQNKRIASAQNLSPFGGEAPEATSPRSNFAPKQPTETPEETSDKPSITVISSEAKASSPRAKFAAPPGVTDEQWKAFQGQRKKALNAHAYTLVCNKLARLAEDGWPPGEMIDLAIERGWETVFAPRNFANERFDRDQTTVALERIFSGNAGAHARTG